MDTFEARRQQLGLGGGGNQNTSDTGTVSVFDKRREQFAQNDRSLQIAQNEQTEMTQAAQTAHDRTIADQQETARSDPGAADSAFRAEISAQPTTKWKGALDNPIVHGAETGLKWLMKPGETVSTALADADSAINNLFGKHTVKGFDGQDITLYPSEKRNLINDVKDIWSQTDSNTSSQAWQGAEPNLGKMPGTNVNWTDVLDFGAQSISPAKLAKPLTSLVGKAGKAIGQDAGLAGKFAERRTALGLDHPSVSETELPKDIPPDRPVSEPVTAESPTISNEPHITPTPQDIKEPAAVTPDNSEPLKQSWFSSLFGHDQNVGITPFGSANSGKMVSTEQQIVNNPLKSTVRGLWNGAKQVSRATYQNTVDYLSPLKNINRETYNTAMDASRANNVANTIIRDKFVNNEGQVIGNSLNDIMKQSRGLGKKLDDYLILRHAETRMSRGERVYDDALNMTPEKAKESYTRLETRYPQLKQIGAEWDKFNTNILDSGVNEGLISQEARDAMREQNPNYASMRRQFTIGEKLAQPKWGSGGSSFSGQRAPIKEYSPTGSTRKIVSPIRSAIEQTYAWKNAELRNRTMQEIAKSIQLDPEGMKGIVEIVKKPSTTYKSLDDALREGGSEEFLQQLDNDFKSLFQRHIPGQENVVRAMVKGSPVFIKVHDPEAVKALLGMGSEQSGIVLGALKKLSNATKRGATGILAPMFAVKNLTADTVQAAIQSPNAFKHVAVDVPVAFFSSIGEALHIPGLRNLAEDFRRSGGEYSALLRGDRGVNNAVYNLRREAPLSPKGIVKGAVGAVKAPFKALEKVSDITENTNRMAAFRRAMIGKERTPENVRNAINAARESTTNFSRRGAFAREIEAGVPYSNAAVQGMYRLTKAIVKNPVKTLAGLGTLVIAPKLYEYAKFNDDPDYQKLPARERYRNFITSKNADGTFNKLPMPPEYEAFGGFLTDVLNHVVKNDPNAYKGTLDALANAWTPPLVSGGLQGLTQGGGMEQSLAGAANATTMAPAAALLANKSFTGAPIVPQRLAGNSPGQQYDERTSSPAQFIGQKIGMSPMKVDYLIRAYGGDPSRLLLPLMSDAGGGTPRNTLLKNFIVDPQVTNTLSNDFYKMKQRITEAESDNKSKGVPLPGWYSKEIADYATTQSKSGIAKQLSNMNDEKRKIQADKSLSAETKANQLRDVQVKMNNIYLDANTRMQKSGVPNR